MFKLQIVTYTNNINNESSITTTTDDLGSNEFIVSVDVSHGSVPNTILFNITTDRSLEPEWLRGMTW